MTTRLGLVEAAQATLDVREAGLVHCDRCTLDLEIGAEFAVRSAAIVNHGLGAALTRAAETVHSGCEK